VLDREFERSVTDIADQIAIYGYLFTDGSLMARLTIVIGE
jgi:hypothetical protein